MTNPTSTQKSPGKRVKITGSDKRALPGAKAIGDVDQAERITVTVLVRRKGGSSTAQIEERALTEQEPLSREAFAAQWGTDTADVDAVEAFAHDHHLTVNEASEATRTLKLSGTLKDLTAAFRPKLKRYRLGKTTYRGRVGDLSVPAQLSGIVEGVFGFDNRPVARAHVRPLNAGPTPRNAADGSLSTLDIGKLYSFPAGLDGSGQCIAIIELGGGFSAKDLSTYFKGLKLAKPNVTAVSVDGGHNAPGNAADAEVMLDIEVTGAIAPKAKIAVYFAPNTDQGFIDAILAAVHDKQRKPSVISISWGGQEESWTQQALSAFNNALQDAATLGVTVCCASGDDGSSDIRDPNQRDGKPHVDFPAASPFALACGGTKLNGTGVAIQSEVVWNEGNAHGASGGGVSSLFARPAYQANAGVPNSPTGFVGRGVPDIAGDADPLTGYQVIVSGKRAVIGGTSAVAPLWAGLVALLNQRLTSASVNKKPVGLLQPFLYANAASGILHDITQGNNDIDGALKQYPAGIGWDACTGLGTPIGAQLLKALGG